jgi:hypothetical protein
MTDLYAYISAVLALIVLVVLVTWGLVALFERRRPDPMARYNCRWRSRSFIGGE